MVMNQGLCVSAETMHAELVLAVVLSQAGALLAPSIVFSHTGVIVLKQGLWVIIMLQRSLVLVKLWLCSPHVGIRSSCYCIRYESTL